MKDFNVLAMGMNLFFMIVHLLVMISLGKVLSISVSMMFFHAFLIAFHHHLYKKSKE